MSSKSLVIVESPTKAKTIGKFLGKDFIVKASMGHVRDLPNSADEIPANVKKEPWSRLGINIDSNFEPLYIIPDSKRDHVKTLREAMKDAAIVYLATDEDREGESISWHLLETLKPTMPIKRLVFHEITKEAIDKSLASPREIDQNLVRAQETRRVVDRLFGYEVSPLLWKKMARGLSAGRVQSVAVKLLVEKERERVKFIKASYWGLKAKLLKANTIPFDSELTELASYKLAIGKDFDPNTGKLKSEDKVKVFGEKEILDLVSRLQGKQATVTNVEEKPYSSSPPAPFVTSTLQQEGNAKLKFSAKHTMRVAQQLYENGFITYMRTDSTTLSSEALNAARSLISEDYGKDYLPDQARVYTTKVKNAQEAHEAIRPAGERFTPISVVTEQLGGDAARLYELIWKRTVASQMNNAKGTNTSVQMTAEDAVFRASGKTIEFPGYLRAYVEGSDNPESDLADREKTLPKLQVGDKLNFENLEPSEHSTQPPARYSEGSLIKELERLGIGRPSTWATIVDLVLSRSYAYKRGNALVPTFTAIAVINLLETHFTYMVDYNFTARFEDDLDAISRGEATNLNYLKSFYFGNGHPGLKSLVQKGQDEIDPRVVCGIAIGNNSAGNQVEVRIGKYGPFLTDGTNRASVPDNVAYDELTTELAESILANASLEPTSLGNHPETNLPIYVKTGRFGPYVQMGEMSDDKKEKPKMASLLPGMTPQEVTLETAIKLLSLPRTVGKNPENGEDIVAANGRFGPYIKCGSDTRSIPQDLTSPIDITVEQAIELLKQPKTRGRQSAAKPATLREIGNHPISQLPLSIKNGRYGPYVTDGTLNASLPKGSDPQTYPLEEAVALLQARAEKMPVKKTRGKKAAAPKAEKAKTSKPKKEKSEAKDAKPAPIKIRKKSQAANE
ncbi:MAG: type I DNA topoisomerase [Proteobacteria bacterium]|nr:type I DNA topoisomerase [Pseudomonadota bacterium]